MTEWSPENYENAPHPSPPHRWGKVREGVMKVFSEQLSVEGKC